MMHELRELTEQLAHIEYLTALGNHGIFVNEREAHSVMLEEVEETAEAMEDLKRAFHRFWKQVRTDNLEALDNSTHDIYIKARELSCEAVQVMAMCEKFWKSAKEW